MDASRDAKSEKDIQELWKNIAPLFDEIMRGILKSNRPDLKGDAFEAWYATVRGRFDLLFEGDFSERYQTETRRIIQNNVAGGMTMNVYLESYGRLIRQMVDGLGAMKGRAPKAVRAQVDTLLAVMLQDMAFNVNYFAEAQNKRLEEERERFASDVEATVGDAGRRVDAAVGGLRDVAADLRRRADHSREDAGLIETHGAELLAQVKSIAASAEELSSASREIAGSAARSNAIAERGAARAQDIESAVGDLQRAGGEIREVIALINKIAKQTNLLALNATIEAARAGQAGAGFAIVASEVKSLARETAEATEGITDQIAEIRAATDTAVDALQSITSMVRQFDEASSSIAAAVDQQTASTEEIAGVARQLAVDTDSAMRRITAIRGGLEENLRSAVDVEGLAGSLADETGQMSAALAAFLSRAKTR